MSDFLWPPWTIACQAPSVHAILQETILHLTDPGIEHGSPALQADSLLLEPSRRLEPDSDPSSMVSRSFCQPGPSFLWSFLARRIIMFHRTIIPGRYSIPECPHPGHQMTLYDCIFLSKTPFQNASVQGSPNKLRPRRETMSRTSPSSGPNGSPLSRQILSTPPGKPGEPPTFLLAHRTVMELSWV